MKLPQDLTMALEMQYPRDFTGGVYSLAKRWQCCSAEFQMRFPLAGPPIRDWPLPSPAAPLPSKLAQKFVILTGYNCTEV